jgi:hypothetical protein
MTYRRSTVVALLLATSVLVCGPGAHANADVASEVTSDLASAGFPDSVVTVETPQAMTAPLDETTEDSLPFDQLKAYVSPNPAAPQPILRVRLSAPSPSPLSGILTTPGFEYGYSDLEPWVVVGRLAVLEAAKHRLASGSALAGVQVDVSSSEPVAPVVLALPEPAALPPRQGFAQLMPLDELRSRLETRLPVWARNATLTVATDSAGERIVTAALALPQQAFVAQDIRDLSESLASAQASMVQEGANIGRTVVKIEDSQTGDPLYVSADDALWSYHSGWYSPMVIAFAEGGDLTSTVGRAAGQVGTAAGGTLPAVP